MEHHIVDAEQPKGEHDYRVVFVYWTFGFISWFILMMALSALIGTKAAFILFFVLLGLAVLLWLLSTGHMRYLHHRRHSHDIDVEQRSQALTERAMQLTETLTLMHGYSASLKMPDGREISWTSPLTIPNGPIHITNNGIEEQKALPAPLPGPIDLRQLLETWQPDGRNILLGIAPGEQLLQVPLKSLCHVALAGATGGGKSTLMRLLLPQLLASGARVALADPHYAPVDPESGEDWRPIAKRLAMEPAVTYASIKDTLEWLAYEELPKRLQLRYQSRPIGEPYFLALDELPAICANIKQAPEIMGTLLREGRKVNILLISAAQDWLVKTIGGSGAVRDCFRTAFYVGGDTTSARVLLDMTGRVDDGTLGKGVVMLRSMATPTASLVRVPSVSNEALYDMLPLPSPLPGHYKAASKEEFIEVASNVTLPALDARSARIREMLLSRSKPREIIQEIWNTSGGSSYVKASSELAEITATLLERGEL